MQLSFASGGATCGSWGATSSSDRVHPSTGGLARVHADRVRIQSLSAELRAGSPDGLAESRRRTAAARSRRRWDAAKPDEREQLALTRRTLVVV
jgi:hypothetical protein